MEHLETVADILTRWLNFPLFAFGDSRVTAWTILYVLVLSFVLFVLAGRLKTLLSDGLLARRNVEIGIRDAIGKLARYALLVFGFVIILQTAGIDLTTVTVLAGALGVGIGFGLQNVVNNFVSGLIILFERPVKVGDRVEIGNISGNITDISIRATTVLTNDNIAVIVPNSRFISDQVINWTHNDATVRFRVSVGVSYDADPEQVRRLLLEVAAEDPAVLEDPAPAVSFDEFGESSLNFTLRAWTRELSARPGRFTSDINFAIHRKFREHGIEVPFPQRVVHVRGAERIGPRRAGYGTPDQSTM